VEAYVTNFADDTVSVIDTSTNSVITTIPVGNEPFGVAIAPDGGSVYIGNYRSESNGPGSVSVIDTADNTVVDTVPLGSWTTAMVMNSAGTTLYVASDEGSVVYVIDVATPAVTFTIPVGDRPNGLAIHPDGTFLYTASGPSPKRLICPAGTMSISEAIITVKWPKPIRAWPPKR
jgi:YVTN family beta-propeller protein